MIDKPKLKNISKALELYPYTENGFFWSEFLTNNNDDISLYNFYQSFIYTFYTKKRFIKVYLAKPNSILFKLISENFGDNEYLKKD